MGEERLKNRDLAQDVYHLKIVLWSIGMGVVGTAIGTMLADLYGANKLFGAIAGMVVGGGGLYFIATNVVGKGAHLASQIYAPEGTPPKREYSQAESLIARGRYEEAAVAFEIHCAEYPEDPDPYFRLARLYATHLERYEEAVVWFRRVRKDAKVSPSEDLVALQETIEILFHKLRDPRKAIPDMAALAQRHADTPAGQAAAKELALMRQLLAEEHAGESKFTEEFLTRAVRQQGDPP
jgi:tetratricopeptide (TPR) repeat protein